MNRLPLSVPSRRTFLKDVAIISAATTGGINLLPVAFGADAIPADHIKKLRLSVKPSLLANGAVVVPTKHLMFLTFPALSADGQAGGRAVIELKGCVQKRFVYTAQSSKLPEVDDLELCEIFEVENSTWAKSLQAATSPSLSVSARATITTQPQTQTPSAPPSALRHFIFTFIETTFTCVASDLHVELRSESFHDTLDYIALRELGD